MEQNDRFLKGIPTYLKNSGPTDNRNNVISDLQKRRSHRMSDSLYRLRFNPSTLPTSFQANILTNDNIHCHNTRSCQDFHRVSSFSLHLEDSLQLFVLYCGI